MWLGKKLRDISFLPDKCIIRGEMPNKRKKIDQKLLKFFFWFAAKNSEITIKQATILWKDQLHQAWKLFKIHKL